MSIQFLTHITSEGERWDLLAWNYYGDPALFRPIVMANPSVPIEPVFQGGMKILIPVIQQSNVERSDLPPWKRIS